MKAWRSLLKTPHLKLVTFTLDTKDKAQDSSAYALEQFQKFVTDRPPSGIALMRDLRKANVEEVIGQAIELLRASGYRLVDAKTCLGLEKRRGLYKGFKEGGALPDLSQSDWQTTDKKCYEI